MKHPMSLFSRKRHAHSAPSGNNWRRASVCLCFAVCAGAVLPGYNAANANPTVPEAKQALVSQQAKKINGRVTDTSGLPVIGANIVEKGTANGTVTDLDGNFSLAVSPGAVLRISYIGYLDKEVPVKSQSVFNILLTEDTQKLDEVVVVGYGTQKKVNLTGAVSNVKADMLENRTTPNTVNMLTG